MSAVLNVQQQLRAVNCYSCGTTFGMESSFYQDRVRDHGEFYCPNGHRQHFIGETEAERLKRQLDAERSRSEFFRRQSESERRSKSAIKGQLTKTKNRIAKGVCPCCNRQFSDLHRHMETKHPDYAASE
jgi:aspartate/glutamate racemase